MPPAPHYLRFVRALTLVSVALPVPVVILASQATACGGKVESTASSDPNRDYIPTGGGGIQGGPCSDQPCGTQALPPDAGHDDDGADAAADGLATDAAPLEEDASDGGGPSRGIPELPRAWSTRLA